MRCSSIMACRKKNVKKRAEKYSFFVEEGNSEEELQLPASIRYSERSSTPDYITKAREESKEAAEDSDTFSGCSSDDDTKEKPKKKVIDSSDEDGDRDAYVLNAVGPRDVPQHTIEVLVKENCTTRKKDLRNMSLIKAAHAGDNLGKNRKDKRGWSSGADHERKQKKSKKVARGQPDTFESKYPKANGKKYHDVPASESKNLKAGKEYYNVPAYAYARSTNESKNKKKK